MQTCANQQNQTNAAADEVTGQPWLAFYYLLNCKTNRHWRIEAIELAGPIANRDTCSWIQDGFQILGI
jgi:hypothetical protein